MTRTYAITNIVIEPFSGSEPTIYAEDFSHPTKHDRELPAAVHEHLNAQHIRIFHGMGEFTEWLHEVGAIVGKCTCTDRPA